MLEYQYILPGLDNFYLFKLNFRMFFDYLGSKSSSEQAECLEKTEFTFFQSDTIDIEGKEYACVKEIGIQERFIEVPDRVMFPSGEIYDEKEILVRIENNGRNNKSLVDHFAEYFIGLYFAEGMEEERRFSLSYLDEEDMINCAKKYGELNNEN